MRYCNQTWYIAIWYIATLCGITVTKNRRMVAGQLSYEGDIVITLGVKQAYMKTPVSIAF
jgi:hypothetical protein